MNKKYKYLFATAAVATLVVPAVASADGGFKDIDSTTYFAEAVNSLTERGIINGYKEDNTFRPYANITRGQAAKIIAEAASLDTENVKNPNFKDVPTTHQFYGAIAALANARIIQGNVDTQTFKPNEPMTRHQMAKVIALAFKLPASNKELPFTDVPSYYEGYVKMLLEHGITTGTTPTTFGGSDYVKRGQLAAFVYRAEAANKQVAENVTLEGEIAAISSNTMTINDKVYDIPVALQQLVNEKNALALEGALVKGTLKEDVVEAVTSITIKKASTVENPVVLQDVNLPVASLSPVAKADFKPTLIIETPYIEMTGFSLSTLNITSNVQNMKLASIQIRQLNIEAEAELTIHGDATIQQAQIASDKRVILGITGKIATLNVTVPRAAIEIGYATNIGNVVTTDGQAASAVISNYADIKANIALENAKKVIEESIPAVTYGKKPVDITVHYLVDEYTLYKYSKKIDFSDKMDEMVAPLGGQVISTTIGDKKTYFEMLINISAFDFMKATLGIHHRDGITVMFMHYLNGERNVDVYSDDPLKKVVVSTLTEEEAKLKGETVTEEAKLAIKKLFPGPITFSEANQVEFKGLGKRIFTIEYNNKKDEIVLEGVYYTIEPMIEDINAQTINTGVKAEDLHPNYMSKYIKFVAPEAIKDSEIIVKGMDDIFGELISVPGLVKP